MGRIAFVTDSTAGIPADLVKKYNITVVPLQVIFGTETFRDGIDLTQDEFFERLKAAKTLPTTSQPSVGDFEEAYKPLVEDPGVDSIISVHLSSALSGTHNAATQAAERFKADGGKKISVVDTQTVYMAEGMMVLDAARDAEQGKSHEEIVSNIERTKHNAKILVLVDTLEYLQKGGRIGNARAFLGGILNVKPILHVEGGSVQPLEQVRTRRKAMDRLVALGVEGAKGRPCRICIGHAQAPEDAKVLASMVREKMNVTEEYSSDLGPVISTHTGPGVLGFVYFPTEG
jgi:DegV family protein with EDD domain